MTKCAGERPYFGIIRLYDDAVVDDRDTTAPIIRGMDDNDFSKSDHLDTQRLFIKDTMGVVSTVDVHDRTVSHSCCTTSLTPMNSWRTSPSPR